MRTVTYHSIRPFYGYNSHVIGRKQISYKMHILVMRHGQRLYVNYVRGVYSAISRTYPVFCYRIKNVRIGRDIYRERVKHTHQRSI